MDSPSGAMTTCPNSGASTVSSRPGLIRRCACRFALAVALLAAPFVRGAEAISVALPDGVKAVWDLDKAHHETTATRERISLNGLWRWQPTEPGSAGVPTGNWGFFKVPGSWPGITDYMQKDSQTLFTHPAWKDVKPGGVVAAWHEREMTVPADWTGRAISLHAEYVNSLATVFVDDVKAGELRFPGGELDLTALCKPGSTHRLSILVVALPLKGVLLSYVDSASAREVKGSVARRGLCGDVSLVGTPRAARITTVAVDASVRRRELAVKVSAEGLQADRRYQFKARVTKGSATVREFASPMFQAGELKDGGVAFTEKWMPDQLWDLHTATNAFELQVSLVDADGRVLDAHWPQRFGFREFWIEGRDFFLNGTRLFLSAVPLDNAQVGAASATYEAARESLRRLKDIGINYVYTHNYGCEPGSHLGFAEILRAADDVGMLVGFTQPHFSHYEWKSPEADQTNGYARHAAFYAAAAGNHPSVVLYVMSHNSTGYEEDMNPDMIDGLRDGRDQWGTRNTVLAMRAEGIVRRLDPRRIVYHHASGNLGVMHNSNFYPNFTPVQELDDWFGHWATTGVKPAFTCEYGAPFTWDWTLYRGWFKGQREWGSAVVPWEYCHAEWNAQFFGDRAFQITEVEKANLRWEAKQYAAGKVWHRWDYPSPVGSDRIEEGHPVFAAYLTSNWRAYRTWGLSGISPWEYGHFWKARPGVDRSRKELKVDWDNLQRPGFSPDYLGQRYERMDTAFETSDWIATPSAQALLRNNRPLLAYVAGKASAFTGKDHNFRAGETVEKQVIVINNSRVTTTCEIAWSLDLLQRVEGRARVTIPTGDQVRVPLKLELPVGLAAGRREIRMTATFDTGEVQEDRFEIDVLPANPAPLPALGRVALFDPKGETAPLLATLGVKAETVAADANLSPFEILIVGKGALTVGGAAPDIARVRDGLKVLLFEQTSEALEQRLGFRVQEYGLRQLFPRVPDHPALGGITLGNLRDWRGSATILPAQLKYEMRSRYGPTVQWAGLSVTRAWRCGNRGNVASVLIEKPVRGDFLPILDGGFSQQYSPLLEYREGRGLVLFCQLDMTGRTEADPAAAMIARNILRHVADWQPAPRRQAVYAGEAAGGTFLESLGVKARAYDGKLSDGDVVVLGPDCAKEVADSRAGLAGFLKSGGCLLAVGLDGAEMGAALPFGTTTKQAEHISTFFEPFGARSLLAGIAPADVHNRDPRPLPLVASGATVVGNGVLAKADNANAVFLQMAPWRFAGDQQANLRRTSRRVSTAFGRLLANMGVAGATPLLGRFSHPVESAKREQRWLDSFYLDRPEEWDDPYRFFRW